MNVTTDVIVGYPTEDEPAFERTLALVREAGITKVHTFSFSARPGTEADRLGDPVPPHEKKRRSRELRGLSEALGRRHRAGKLGGAEEVLVDKVADSQVSGYSRDYTRYYLAAGTAGPGDIAHGARRRAARGRARRVPGRLDQPSRTPPGTRPGRAPRAGTRAGGAPSTPPAARRRASGCRGRRRARIRSAGSTRDAPSPPRAESP